MGLILDRGYFLRIVIRAFTKYGPFRGKAKSDKVILKYFAKCFQIEVSIILSFEISNLVLILRFACC